MNGNLNGRREGEQYRDENPFYVVERICVAGDFHMEEMVLDGINKHMKLYFDKHN